MQKSIKEYLDDLASRQPVPGGGSAASLAGALGAALLEMACNFTIGHKKYKDAETPVSHYLEEIKKIRGIFLSLVDEDVKVYSSICEAFKTKDEKIIDNSLKQGYYISLKICGLAKSSMDIASGLAEKSNVNLITDVGCGAELLKASFESAALNSEINLKGIKDTYFIGRESQAIPELKKEISTLHKKTMSSVRERMV